MNDTKRIQNEIIKIFEVFKEICEENNLQYYSIGGTCLGAVRHKGFIPWDDDMDVAMPWNDYIRFIDICKKRLPKAFELQSYKKNGKMIRKFSKLINRETTFIESDSVDNYDLYTGIFLDIFPLVGCPKNTKKCQKFISVLNFYNILNGIQNTKLSEIHSIKSQIIWLFFKPYTVLKKNDYFFEKWESYLSLYEVGYNNDILMPWRIPLQGSYKNVFDYSLFDNGIELDFENTKVNCPKNYSQYLTMDFGDYMILPPKEKQVTHAPAILDFNNSYTKYIK